MYDNASESEKAIFDEGVDRWVNANEERERMINDYMEHLEEIGYML